jgi:hypothetical protein
MRLKRSSALVLGALATVAGISAAVAAGWAPPATGAWQCFNADKFPHPAAGPARWLAWDATVASKDEGPMAFAAGLNQVARNSPMGSTLSVPFEPAFGKHYNLICVKY